MKPKSLYESANQNISDFNRMIRKLREKRELEELQKQAQRGCKIFIETMKEDK